MPIFCGFLKQNVFDLSNSSSGSIRSARLRSEKKDQASKKIRRVKYGRSRRDTPPCHQHGCRPASIRRRQASVWVGRSANGGSVRSTSRSWEPSGSLDDRSRPASRVHVVGRGCHIADAAARRRRRTSRRGRRTRRRLTSRS